MQTKVKYQSLKEGKKKQSTKEIFFIICSSFLGLNNFLTVQHCYFLFISFRSVYRSDTGRQPDIKNCSQLPQEAGST